MIPQSCVGFQLAAELRLWTLFVVSNIAYYGWQSYAHRCKTRTGNESVVSSFIVYFPLFRFHYLFLCMFKVLVDLILYASAMAAIRSISNKPSLRHGLVCNSMRNAIDCANACNEALEFDSVAALGGEQSGHGSPSILVMDFGPSSSEENKLLQCKFPQFM